MSEPILEARQLSVVLGGYRVIDVPSLKLSEREVLMIIGPNGSGKTTLLLSLALLVKPSAGEIFYRGKAIHSARNITKCEDGKMVGTFWHSRSG